MKLGKKNWNDTEVTILLDSTEEYLPCGKDFMTLERSDEVLYIRFDRRTYNSWYVQIEVQIAFCGILQRMPQNAIWISIWKPRKLFSTH